MPFGRVGEVSKHVPVINGTFKEKKIAKNDEKIFQKKRVEIYQKSLAIGSFIDNSKRESLQRNNYDDIRAIFLAKWRFSTLKPFENFLENQVFLNSEFQKTKKVLKLERRWPACCLTKNQFAYERQLLDFEREIFYKRRLRILMNSIATESAKRLRLIKVISFYKLIASTVFIDQTDPSSAQYSNKQVSCYLEIDKTHLKKNIAKEIHR